MKISYSSVVDWRQCQQLFDYRYAQGLEPKLQFPAPTLGRILHRYLERYYTLGRDLPASEAHEQAKYMLSDEYEDEVAGLAFAARAADDNKLAEELACLLDRANRIIRRYYLVRGQVDLGVHKTVLAEQKIIYPLDDRIEIPCIVDLVTEDQQGKHWLWEHKTSSSIPPTTRRLKDLQTTLLAAIIEEALGIKVDGVIWNYLRTKEPTVPALLKSGEITRRSDLDSTWETYLGVIDENDLDWTDYADVKERLAGREESSFFPRHQMPIMQSEQVLLRDFEATARAMYAIYSSGVGFVPVRNVSGMCDWCSFSRLCEAAILGGDDEEIIDRLFKRRETRIDNGS